MKFAGPAGLNPLISQMENGLNLSLPPQSADQEFYPPRMKSVKTIL